MSSGQKRVAEDEDDWYDFQKTHNILTLKYKLYEPEYYFAKEAVKLGFTYVNIAAFVELRKSQNATNVLLELERKERVEYERLRKKYGSL